MLPYTNADAGSKSKFKHAWGAFNAGYVAHCAQCMRKSAKLLFASIAACINGFIPHVFKYTAMSVCLSIVEYDLQKNRVPIPATRPSGSLNDIIITFDAKME